MYSARLHLPRRAVGSPSPASPLSSAAVRPRRLKVSPRPSRSRFTIAISELLDLCPRASGFGIQSVARVRRKSSSISLAAPISAMDEDSFGGFSLLDDEGYEMPGGHIWSSGDESDTDLVVNSSADVDLPRRRETESPDSMLTVTAHRFATIQRGYRNNRISGVMINMGLIAFFSLFLIFVDWCSWRIVRLPLEPFYLTRPFSISAVLSACVGCLYVPLVDSMKIHQIVKKKGPIIRSKRAIPTTGGLFFIPIGITIARSLSGEHSIPVYGAALATMIFAAIGLLDDILNRSKDESNGVPRWIKFILLVAVSTWFSFWLNSSNISTPYSMYIFF